MSSVFLCCYFRFFSEDIDFNLRAHTSSLVLCQLNRFSVMKKFISIGGETVNVTPCSKVPDYCHVYTVEIIILHVASHTLRRAYQSIQSFVLQGMWSYSFIASCNGLQGDVAQYAANQTRNTGANPFSLRQLHWVLLHELHKTLGPRALYSTRRMQQ